MTITTWDKHLRYEFSVTGDNYSKMVTTLTNEELHKEFDSGYGGEEGTPFTAWGDKYVYFPVCYDGAEWVGYAPRNLCDIITEHQGG